MAVGRREKISSIVGIVLISFSAVVFIGLRVGQGSIGQLIEHLIDKQHLYLNDLV